MRRAPALLLVLLLAAPVAFAAPLELSESVVMRAAAVAPSGTAFVGSTASITITVAKNGTGHVFLDTFPLAEVDMQGSARLAARVASRLTGSEVHERDFFYVVRSNSQQIGGPSAGASLAVGTVAAIQGWKVRDDALMTGTIQPDARVGPVGGIAEKATAAAQSGIRRFLFPAGQENVTLGDRIVDITAYCRDELAIECVGVQDVYQAVSLMTDHVMVRPPVVGNVTGEAFLRRLGPLSAQLVEGAARLEEEARVALEPAPDVPAKTELSGRLVAAHTTLERARAALTNQTYYTAASLSFQSAIEFHYVRDGAEMIRSDDPQAVAHAAVERTAAEIDAARARIDAARPGDPDEFEAVGAAQVRLLEAETRLAQARDALEGALSAAEIYRGLYEGAYASERVRTALWWLDLSPPGGGEPIDREALVDFARDTITISREETAYAEAVLAGVGVRGPLEAPRESLRIAEQALARGYVAASIHEALEAGVRASVILELATFGGVVPESKIEAARVEAARAIQEARGRGVESLLAQSSYEFGLGLAEPADRLTFLGLARVQANLAGLPGVLTPAPEPTTESRFQGLAPPLPVFPPTFVAAAFAVGLALGVGGALVAMMPREEE